MQSGSISPNLMYLANRMSGFSTNTFKLETENQSSATSGSIVSVNLPSNSIINLRSFKMFFNAVFNVHTIVIFNLNSERRNKMFSVITNKFNNNLIHVLIHFCFIFVS